MTFLRRVGNKTKLANKICELFPKHKTYIELFFGAGGLFFNKEKARYNLLNDLDDDIYNLFSILQNKRKRLVLKKQIENSFYCTKVFEYYKNLKPENGIEKATKFLYLSNFSYLGMGDTLKIASSCNSKRILINNLEGSFEILKDCQFTNCDFRKFTSIISFRDDSDYKNTVFYADPPYLDTNNNYSNYSNSFIKEDVVDLMDLMMLSKSPFAYSEFNNPFILEQAKLRGFYITEISNRQTIKNRNTEILITNYNPSISLFKLSEAV